MDNNTELHMLSLFLNGIKTLGIEAVEEAIKHLTEHKTTIANFDLAPCPQGYHRDANGVCVPDVGGKQ